ncbi:MAG: hypothetical protein KDB07_09255, partial [Planctomycetes bacterium]|nr:hypothetical protein [Planctomycetota bacterium]
GDPLYTPYAPNAAEKQIERRKLVLSMLSAKEDRAESMAGDDTLAIAAHHFLRKRVDEIESLLKKNQSRAIERFTELAFMTRDMDLEKGLLAGFDKLNKALEKEFKDIKAKLKKRSNDTEAYSEARRLWAGLPIAEDIAKFHESFVKDQTKDAEDWLKKAEKMQEANAYEAWKLANQAALCEYAGEVAKKAQTLADEIDVANRKEDRYLRTPNRELKSILNNAKQIAERKPDEAIEMLRHAVRDYPKCGPRNDCEKELAAIRKRVAEAEASKK